MKVIKRDGSTVEFDKSKIREAITKSMKNGSGIFLADIAGKPHLILAVDHYTKGSFHSQNNK